MKKTVGKMFKRIVSTTLVATLTLGTAYMAYTRDGSNTNVVETERPHEAYVVEDEKYDLQCSNEEAEKEVVKTDSSNTLQENVTSKVDENTVISTNNYPQNSTVSNEKVNDTNSVNSNEKYVENVTIHNTNASTVESPEVTVDENESLETELTDTLDDIKKNEIYMRIKEYILLTIQMEEKKK